MLVVARPGTAFEFLDGDLQVHGFFTEQIRFVGRDLSFGDDMDLAQWYNVLNLEIEYMPLADGWGPFDVVSFYGRVEGRYDCVWKRGCGLFDSVNTFGDRAEHLPKRLIDAHRSGYDGQLETGDRRPYAGVGRLQADYGFLNEPRHGRRDPLQFFQTPGFSTLFGISGPDQVLGTADDPASFVYDEILRNCIFAARRYRGPNNGLDTERSQGPWNPGCSVTPLGRLRAKPNPINPEDENLVVLGPGGFGSGELPFQPAPRFRADGTPRTDLDGSAPIGPAARPWDARGIFIPNRAEIGLIREDAFDAFDQNFRENDLAWNRGASQDDEKELKELYADLELFDSRLWLRIGKQSIVWGKTELFRTTDQFNPQDLALASLPSLEESRVALWAARGTWSFYEVGPFEDVRLELAVNYDDFEPADLGDCGEPFTANPVCDKSFGLFAHGLTGVGLAGEFRPDNPWDSARGLEVGGRIEWRWRRFSFQLSDFYGYNDFPHPEIIFPYERNVDPRTGRPRRLQSRAGCDFPNGDVSGCLGVLHRDPGTGDFTSPVNPFTDLDGDGLPERKADLTVQIPDDHRADVLENHSVNQTMFAMVCATSVGASNLAPESCGQNIFSSRTFPTGLFATLTRLFTTALAGESAAAGLLGPPFAGVTLPLVPLNRDPGDETLGSGRGANVLADIGLPVDPDDKKVPPDPFIFPTLSLTLTPYQEALLGCGPFYGTNCDDDGIALGNLETSALMQSWTLFEGSFGRSADWTTDVRFHGAQMQPQPGTVDPGPDGVLGSDDDIRFRGGALCTRYEDGQLYVLPGCRGADYNAQTLAADFGLTNVAAQYDPVIDGCSRPRSGPNDSFEGCNDGDTVMVDTDGDGVPEPITRSGDASVLAIPNVDRDGIPGPDFGSATGLVFQSEMAALSWNQLMILVAFSQRAPDTDPPLLSEIDPTDPFGHTRSDNACSFRRPTTCFAVTGLMNLSGVQRNDLRAAGNGRFGRRDFIWFSGSSTVLAYEKRNVLGFAFDWAEDRTKTNWGVESTWIRGVQFTDLDEPDSLTESDTFNLTVSVDRPTFFNFLNPNRTFLLNTQWFFQYVPEYRSSFTTNGPLNVLATLTVFTGYHQDRLFTFVTGVYDFPSSSGGFLAQVIYRFTENFSAAVGMNLFSGRFESRTAPLTNFGPNRNRAGRSPYNSFWENGLSAIRDRDELNLTIRYTF